MDLRHLRYFITVAEELHFRRAAERLHLAQPSLSQQIHGLENELGVQLLNRTRRRVQLTQAGRRFLEEARRTLAQAERAVRIAQQTSRGEIGLLSIGFVPAADYTVFPKLLPAFRRHHPGVQLMLRTLSSMAQVEALRDGLIDIGFLRRPADDKALAVQSILREPLVVALPAAHPLSALREVPLLALAKERYIFFPREMAPSFYDLVVSRCHEAGFSLNVTHEAEHFQTMLGLIASGLGVALVPNSVRTLGKRGVRFRQLPAPVPHVELAMAYRRDDDSDLLRAFLNTARDVLPPAAL
jgi:DNA-binding transcriptional LysR family regulator